MEDEWKKHVVERWSIRMKVFGGGGEVKFAGPSLRSREDDDGWTPKIAVQVGMMMMMIKGRQGAYLVGESDSYWGRDEEYAIGRKKRSELWSFSIHDPGSLDDSEMWAARS